MQARICRQTRRCVLAVRTIWVVAQFGDFPAHAVPHLVQVMQRRTEHGFGVAPDLQMTFASIDFRRFGMRFTDKVAEFAQTMRAQQLHDGVALRRADLNHRAQLFVEQRLERQFLAPCTHLPCPVFAVAGLHSAVGDTIALGHQHVYVDGHADVPRKRHLRHAGQQAAVALVVVGQNLAVRAQGVDGVDQIDQVLGIVQIRHAVTKLINRLRQNATRHAVLAFAEVDQDQRRVGFGRVQLRGERAAHVGQSRKSGDDQADG